MLLPQVFILLSKFDKFAPVHALPTWPALVGDIWPLDHLERDSMNYKLGFYIKDIGVRGKLTKLGLQVMREIQQCGLLSLRIDSDTRNGSRSSSADTSSLPSRSTRRHLARTPP